MITHYDAGQSAGLLWTSDQLVAEATHNTHKRQISMPPAGFEPTISADERLQKLNIRLDFKRMCWENGLCADGVKW